MIKRPQARENPNRLGPGNKDKDSHQKIRDNFSDLHLTAGQRKKCGERRVTEGRSTRNWKRKGTTQDSSHE